MDPYENDGKKILSPLDKAKKEKEQSESESRDEVKESLSGVSKFEATNESVDTTDDSESEPTFIEHLIDFRKQLIRSAIVFVLAFIVVFASINYWFPYVTRGHDLVMLGPLEVVKFYMTISASIALGLSLPFICHFIWQFVSPGLTEKENRFLSLYAPVMLLLFLGGVMFGYFVVHPLSYNFLTALGGVNFTVMVSAQEYASFLLLTTIPIGLLFELPIVAMFFAVIGLVTAESMAKMRKWAYLGLAITSALITPPDFVSQLIVLVPMIGLYEISIRIVRRIEYKQTLAEAS